MEEAKLLFETEESSHMPVGTLMKITLFFF